MSLFDGVGKVLAIVGAFAVAGGILAYHSYKDLMNDWK